MRGGGAACVTYEDDFVAVRHESDLLTPLFHAPLVSLSVRELGYVGAFVVCAMLSFAGSAPPWLAAAGLALAVAAFLRWRGEMPEMYLYYAALAALESPRGGRRRQGSAPGASGGRRGPLRALLGALRPPPDPASGTRHQVEGPGAEHVLGSGTPAPAPGGGPAGAPACERVLIGRAGPGGALAPVDLALDLGASRAHAGVVVRVDGAELVRDTANGEGMLTVTLIPRAGARRIEVLGAGGGAGGDGALIASHVVEFAGDADATAGGEAAGGGGGGGDGAPIAPRAAWPAGDADAAAGGEVDAKAAGKAAGKAGSGGGGDAGGGAP